MRKIKSTALLGAFVAVASVGVISHEAHGAMILTNGTAIPKEMLPDPSVSLQASIYPTVGFNSSNSSITLTISGANFITNDSYTISGAGCANTPSSGTSLTLTGCNVSASTVYAILSGSNGVFSTSSFTVSVNSPSTTSIVLSYSSNVKGDTPYSVIIAQVMPQLAPIPNSVTQAVISSSNSYMFTNGFNSATNSVVIINNAYNNSTWSNTINAPIQMTFDFTNIPSSVTSISATDSAGTNSVLQPLTPPLNQSASVQLTLDNTKAPFQNNPSDTISFGFFNSGNIQAGTILLSSITGLVSGNSYSYVYPFTPQNFITFAYSGVQIYIPDALVPDSNAIQYSYLTISMPPGASIASISALNTGVTCSVSSISLTHTGTPGVYYMSLGQLVQACPGISSTAWQSGVPLVITIANATTSQVTADAYAVFGGMLKRIPVNVINGNGSNNFSY